MQNESSQGVHLVCTQAARIIEGHCAPYVVPQRCRIRPVTADGLHRLRSSQAANTANQRWILTLTAFAVVVVALGTSGLEQIPRLLRCSSACRESAAVWKHGEIHRADFGIIRRTTE